MDALVADSRGSHIERAIKLQMSSLSTSLVGAICVMETQHVGMERKVGISNSGSNAARRMLGMVGGLRNGLMGLEDTIWAWRPA